MTQHAPDQRPALVGPAGEDRLLVAALRRGDEQAFTEVVARFEPMLARVARAYLRDDASVADAVQETWVNVLRGLDRFEGRSTFRTWVVGILLNVARSAATRQARTVPLASLSGAAESPAVEADRFRGPHDPWPGHWVTFPARWPADPLDAALAAEVRRAVRAAMVTLPPVQRTVIMLRDVQGWSAEEVCQVLDLTPGNQRVLLHRARAHVRRALDDSLSSRGVSDDRGTSRAVTG